MKVSRMHILTLLSIYILIGSMAYNANGDCYRPIFTNPYAILLDPDQQTYTYYYPIELKCIDGHTIFGLPDRTYCGSKIPTFWDPDPSDGLCEAQCNTIDLLDDDIVVMVNGSQQSMVDSRTTAQFSCRGPGQFTGLASATCTNGTFDYSAEPSCLAYCPVYPDELGVGLYYDIADDPVMNETSTLYYRDGDVISYRCSDGYEGPQKRTPSDDGTSTCIDGSWDPPGIPICMATTTGSLSTPRSSSMTTPPSIATSPHIAMSSSIATSSHIVTSFQTTVQSPLPFSEKCSESYKEVAIGVGVVALLLFVFGNVITFLHIKLRITVSKMKLEKPEKPYMDLIPTGTSPTYETMATDPVSKVGDSSYENQSVVTQHQHINQITMVDEYEYALSN